MLFRDSISSNFPRKAVSDDIIQTARHNDSLQKLEYQDRVNSSKYKKYANVSVGDQILIRNYKKRSKFEPLFLPEPFVITSISDQGRKLELERISDGRSFYRHPDDVKKMVTPHIPTMVEKRVFPDPWDKHWKNLSEASQDFDAVDWGCHDIQPDEVVIQIPADPDQIPVAAAGGGDVVDQAQPAAVNQPAVEVRRSGRETRKPDKMGAVVYDDAHPLRGEDLVIAPWWPGYPRNNP